MKRLIPERWRGRREADKPARRLEDNVHPLLSLRDEMNRLFESFFGELPDFRTWAGGKDLAAFHPRMDVAETDKAITVTVELPGMDEKDVEVSLSQGVLSIRGEKKEEKRQEDARYHYVERRQGSFYREVALPPNVDTNKTHASFRKGVLTVTVPKSAKAEKDRKVIPVSAG